MKLGMIRLCDRCGAKLPQDLNCCACGGLAVDYLEPGEAAGKGDEKNKGPLGVAELGAALGSALTNGSTAGAVVGHAVGRAIEKLGEKDVVTFHEMPPEPPTRDIGKETAIAVKAKSEEMLKKVGGAVSKVFRRKKPKS